MCSGLLLAILADRQLSLTLYVISFDWLEKSYATLATVPTLRRSRPRGEPALSMWRAMAQELDQVQPVIVAPKSPQGTPGPAHEQSSHALLSIHAYC